MTCTGCGGPNARRLFEYMGPGVSVARRGDFCEACADGVAEVMSGAALTSDGYLQAPCDHGLTFDASAARGKTVEEVRQQWPRLDGTCPKGCGFHGVKYVNVTHYVAGGWHLIERRQ